MGVVFGAKAGISNTGTPTLILIGLFSYIHFTKNLHLVLTATPGSAVWEFPAISLCNQGAVPFVE
jgi:hypothetical protein